MMFFYTLPVVTVALTHTPNNSGSLYIPQVAPAGQELQISEGNLVLGSNMATFQYHSSGTLKCVETGQYVYINALGRLVSGAFPQHGFQLTYARRRHPLRRLSYNGDEYFQLCGDNSVAYRSTCEGAREIIIGYENHFVEEAESP
ncbi:hypothetical protein JCM33374_g1675 [Metschnikowia sp. JCM 33374]|nr:hypothetical protein JCM33374_g1675 [Metschnikowia sp. JCM 33374]